MATSEKAKRIWMSVPVTAAQKAAIVGRSRKLGLSPTNYARMKMLSETDYDPESDPDWIKKDLDGD